MYLIWIRCNTDISCRLMIGTFVVESPRILVEETVRSTAAGTFRISQYTPPLRLDLLKTTSYPATKLPNHWETVRMKNHPTSESTARLDCQLGLHIFKRGLNSVPPPCTLSSAVLREKRLRSGSTRRALMARRRLRSSEHRAPSS
jgi:hypothetical protein